MLNYHATPALFMSPQNLIKWVLADTITTGAETTLTPRASLEAQTKILDDGPVPLAAAFTPGLGRTVQAVSITIADSAGKTVFSDTMKPKSLPAPWKQGRSARTEWKLKSTGDGVYTVSLVAHAKDDSVIGTLSRRVLVGRQAMRDARAAVDDGIDRLRAAKLPELAQARPFAATAHLAAAVTIERLKRCIELENLDGMDSTRRELAARFDVLADGKLDMQDPGDLDLLALTGDPDAQVIAEFMRSPGVAFSWGAIPLACAWLETFPSADEAKKRFGSAPKSLVVFDPELATLDGLPARVTTTQWDSWPAQAAAFRPDTHLLLVNTQARRAYVLNASLIANARVDAAAALPDCPQAVRENLDAWAKAANVPLLPLDEALAKNTVLLAGNVNAQPAAAKLDGFKFSTATVRRDLAEMSVLKGDRIYSTSNPTRQMSEQILRLVLAGKPVTPEQVDGLRQMLVKTAGQLPPEPLPDGMNLFCGDVHMHSFYSDGSLSPVGIVLQTIHCFEDFSVLTDHNTIEGARVAGRLFADHGIAFPLTIGQEITMRWSHMNAYPLAEPVTPELPPYELTKAAHEQGAVIQWNHPGFPDSDWALAHMNTQLDDTGCDAWEHVPPTFDDWKQAGKLPVVVGSTDTHSGACSTPAERTIILAPTPQGPDLAEAVRRGQVLAVEVGSARVIYGHDTMLGRAISALAEGRGLKQAKAHRITEALKDADIPALLQASPPRVVTVGELSKTR